MAYWLMLLAAPCLVTALPTTVPARRAGLPALPSAHRAARHRLSALPLPSADELTSLASLSTAIGGGGAHVLDGIVSTLSTLTVAASGPSVNPVEFIEQAERNVGIGFMQQVCSDS